MPSHKIGKLMEQMLTLCFMEKQLESKENQRRHHSTTCAVPQVAVYREAMMNGGGGQPTGNPNCKPCNQSHCNAPQPSVNPFNPEPKPMVLPRGWYRTVPKRVAEPQVPHQTSCHSMESKFPSSCRAAPVVCPPPTAGSALGERVDRFLADEKSTTPKKKWVVDTKEPATENDIFYKSMDWDNVIRPNELVRVLILGPRGSGCHTVSNEVKNHMRKKHLPYTTIDFNLVEGAVQKNLFTRPPFGFHKIVKCDSLMWLKKAQLKGLNCLAFPMVPRQIAELKRFAPDVLPRVALKMLEHHLSLIVNNQTTLWAWVNTRTNIVTYFVPRFTVENEYQETDNDDSVSIGNKSDNRGDEEDKQSTTSADESIQEWVKRMSKPLEEEENPGCDHGCVTRNGTKKKCCGSDVPTQEPVFNPEPEPSQDGTDSDHVPDAVSEPEPSDNGNDEKGTILTRKQQELLLQGRMWRENMKHAFKTMAWKLYLNLALAKTPHERRPAIQAINNSNHTNHLFQEMMLAFEDAVWTNTPDLDEIVAKVTIDVARFAENIRKA